MPRIDAHGDAGERGGQRGVVVHAGIVAVDDIGAAPAELLRECPAGAQRQSAWFAAGENRNPGAFQPGGERPLIVKTTERDGMTRLLLGES
jgi:hypothetical protein